MSKKSVWKHKTKYKGKEFEGAYGWNGKSRFFSLVQRNASTPRVIEFESHEAAKAAGWVKVK